MSREIMKKLGIEKLDLKSITRPGVVSCIYLGRGREEWIECGQLDISYSDGNHQWSIGARLGRGATDDEHDSAWAFTLPAVGVQFEFVSSGIFHFFGHIATPQNSYGLDAMKIPLKSYDQFNEGEMCTRCDDSHPIVDYLPNGQEDLYRKLAGRYFEIAIYPDDK